jgi:hypothetical protein
MRDLVFNRGFSRDASVTTFLSHWNQAASFTRSAAPEPLPSLMR